MCHREKLSKSWRLYLVYFWHTRMLFACLFVIVFLCPSPFKLNRNAVDVHCLHINNLLHKTCENVLSLSRCGQEQHLTRPSRWPGVTTGHDTVWYPCPVPPQTNMNSTGAGVRHQEAARQRQWGFLKTDLQDINHKFLHLPYYHTISDNHNEVSAL